MPLFCAYLGPRLQPLNPISALHPSLSPDLLGLLLCFVLQNGGFVCRAGLGTFGQGTPTHTEVSVQPVPLCQPFETVQASPCAGGAYPPHPPPVQTQACLSMGTPSDRRFSGFVLTAVFLVRSVPGRGCVPIVEGKRGCVMLVVVPPGELCV